MHIIEGIEPNGKMLQNKLDRIHARDHLSTLLLKLLGSFFFFFTFHFYKFLLDYSIAHKCIFLKPPELIHSILQLSLLVKTLRRTFLDLLLLLYQNYNQLFYLILYDFVMDYR